MIYKVEARVDDEIIYSDYFSKLKDAVIAAGLAKTIEGAKVSWFTVCKYENEYIEGKAAIKAKRKVGKEAMNGVVCDLQYI